MVLLRKFHLLLEIGNDILLLLLLQLFNNTVNFLDVTDLEGQEVNSESMLEPGHSNSQLEDISLEGNGLKKVMHNGSAFLNLPFSVKIFNLENLILILSECFLVFLGGVEQKAFSEGKRLIVFELAFPKLGEDILQKSRADQD